MIVVHRKKFIVQNSDGRAVRITIGSKSITSNHMDPTGFLTVSSPPGTMSETEKVALSAAIAEHKRKVESGEISYS